MSVSVTEESPLAKPHASDAHPTVTDSPAEARTKQDFSRFKRAPPGEATIAGIKVMLTDDGDTRFVMRFGAEQTREAAIAFITHHVQDPDLTNVSPPISAWSTAAILGWATGVAKALGLEDFV